MLDKIVIVDFEDSFTYNIANVLYPFEKSIKVISHEEFFAKTMFEISHSSSKLAVILGPGPGHPEDYRAYFKDIKTLMGLSHIYLLGICLGHQLMALVDGCHINYAKEQMHGHAVDLDFEGVKLKVQKYNSLAVFRDGAEVDICRYHNGISYQFHPESIGTQNNQLFFRELIRFIS